MSDRFKKAMPFIFEHEGKYNNHIEDKGGATNWGVSLRLLESLHKDIDGDGDVDLFDIKALSKEEAEQIYFDNFWKPLYDRVIYEYLAIKMFDTGINMGTLKSNKILQRALNNLGSNLKDDGIIGQQTLSELIKYSENSIINEYCREQKEVYAAIILRDPTQVKFKNGWNKRADWCI